MLKKRYVAEVLVGEESIKWLAGEYREVVVANKEPSGSERRARADLELGPDQSLEVLAPPIADRAAKEPVVIAFRERHFEGRTLSVRAMVRWIRELAQDEGSPVPWGHLGGDRDDPDEPITDANLERKHVAYLRYVVPGEGARGTDVNEIPLPQSGVLADLQRLASNLAKRTRWDEYSTTTFILTGRTPPVGLIRVNIDTWYGAQAYGPLRVRRMELSIHPNTTPTELAAFYRRAREQIMPAPRARRRSKTRPPSLLVEFVDSLPNAKWQERFDAWNRAHPDLTYGAITNMQRDYRHALKLVKNDSDRGPS
ncbi:MAG TPA: hypothetical protein VGW38_29655 [Chloroflexota bacterium]|nr:hypothetical protein [Chloroflexota bacterium]